MKARIVRSDSHYDVTFSRPAFEQIASFTHIIEPIYDVFSSEVSIPSDAINVENGNTIATSVVTLTLFSGRSVFEARLDGYKAHSFDLHSIEDVERARRHAKLFETAICEFLTDSVPAYSKLATPSWLAVDGGKIATEVLVRSLTWLPEANDPFQIGATEIHSRIKFDCLNNDENWITSITVDKSVMSEADLFLEISSEYTYGSQFDSFDKMAVHHLTVSQAVIDKLNLTIE